MTNPLERPLRRLEHLMGAQRDDRSLWAWAGPIGTTVITFVFLILFGVLTNIDLGLTIPMGLVMALLLGTLSAFYLTASSADAADDDDDGGSAPLSRPPDRGPGVGAPGDVAISPTDHRVRVAERDGAEAERETVPLTPLGRP